MQRTLACLVALAAACGSESRPPEPPRRPAPVAEVTRPPSTEEPPPAPTPVEYALATLEGRDYECTFGEWQPHRSKGLFPTRGEMADAIFARVTPAASAPGQVLVQWRGGTPDDRFASNRGPIAWPPHPGAPPDAPRSHTALAASPRALLLREDVADAATRILLVPARGAAIELVRPDGAPFDPGAVLFHDGRFTVQWNSSLRDVVTVLGEDGTVQATRTFEWRQGGHGVLRGLGLYRADVGLLVEEPGTPGRVVLQPIDPAREPGPSFPLPAPFSLAPCVGSKSNDAVTMFDRWLTPLLSSDEMGLSGTATEVEIGPGGSCLRSFHSEAPMDDAHAVFDLRAADAHSLSGLFDDGRRHRTMRCAVPGAPSAAAAPPAGACVTVDIGLDLRALPTGSPTSGIDMFSGGQASDFAAKAPAGPPPELRTMSGFGGFAATFRDATVAAARRRCEATVRAYMATAPRLPVIMEPAANVVQACRPCP